MSSSRKKITSSDLLILIDSPSLDKNASIEWLLWMLSQAWAQQGTKESLPQKVYTLVEEKVNEETNNLIYKLKII